jgi:antitoxin component HigA of HigAB toxin-antitoxin module
VQGGEDGMRNGNSRDTISQLDVEILLLITGGVNKNKDLHKKLMKRNAKRVPKSTISRHTKHLRQLKLIKQSKMFNLRPFTLTNKGKETISIFLAMGEAPSLEFPVRGHAFGFVSKVVRCPEGFGTKLRDGGWVEYYPRNRVAYKNRVMGCLVVFNPRSVQFIPDEVYGPNQDACFDEAFRLVVRVKECLEDNYGLVLGQPKEVTRIYSQHYAKLFDPLAMEYFKTSLEEGLKVTYRSDRLHIDFSKGFPETEAVHRVYSKDDLRKITDLYETIVRQDFNLDDFLFEYHKKYDEITNGVEAIQDDLRNVKEVIRDLAKNIGSHIGVMKSIGRSVDDLAQVVGDLKKVVNIFARPFKLIDNILKKFAWPWNRKFFKKGKRRS